MYDASIERAIKIFHDINKRSPSFLPNVDLLVRPFILFHLKLTSIKCHSVRMVNRSNSKGVILDFEAQPRKNSYLQFFLHESIVLSI